MAVEIGKSQTTGSEPVNSWAHRRDAGRTREMVLCLSCATLRKEVAQYLPKLRHRRKTADDGGEPREFP
jgi:hypothetical protein